MPRSPRIEFEDATYHVMARGNRREPIVFNDSDRQMFVDTFEEAALMTGWEVFAWTLLDNHYHAVFRTPHANLVDGMRWFQNTFTRRINSRHRLWGHLFGGRYRSLLIENQDYGGPVWRDYLRTAIDYVHLNPGRAGIVDLLDPQVSCSDYQFSSLGTAFQLPPSKRPSWMAVSEVLDLYQFKDSAKGRRDHTTRIDQWIRDEKGFPEVEGRSLEQRIKRGWYWGGNEFKEAMLKLYEQSMKKSGRKGNRVYQSGSLVKDHAEQTAEAILCAARSHFGLTKNSMKQLVRGDYTRAAIATRIHKETTVSQSWIAEQLGMKSAANVSRQIQVFQRIEEKDLPKLINQWVKIKNF